MFDPMVTSLAFADYYGFQPIVAAIARESAAYGGPVYLFNDDSHVYNAGKSLARLGLADVLPHRPTGAEPVRVTVDGVRDDGPGPGRGPARSPTPPTRRTGGPACRGRAPSTSPAARSTGSTRSGRRTLPDQRDRLDARVEPAGQPDRPPVEGLDRGPVREARAGDRGDQRGGEDLVRRGVVHQRAGPRLDVEAYVALPARAYRVGVEFQGGHRRVPQRAWRNAASVFFGRRAGAAVALDVERRRVRPRQPELGSSGFPGQVDKSWRMPYRHDHLNLPLEISRLHAGLPADGPEGTDLQMSSAHRDDDGPATRTGLAVLGMGAALVDQLEPMPA